MSKYAAYKTMGLNSMIFKQQFVWQNTENLWKIIVSGILHSFKVLFGKIPPSKISETYIYIFPKRFFVRISMIPSEIRNIV